MPETTNASRAKSAEKALAKYVKDAHGQKATLASLHEGDLECLVYDLIGDLLHYAASKGFDTEKAIRLAKDHFSYECYEEAEKAKAKAEPKAEPDDGREWVCPMTMHWTEFPDYGYVKTETGTILPAWFDTDTQQIRTYETMEQAKADNLDPTTCPDLYSRCYFYDHLKIWMGDGVPDAFIEQEKGPKCIANLLPRQPEPPRPQGNIQLVIEVYNGCVQEDIEGLKDGQCFRLFDWDCARIHDLHGHTEEEAASRESFRQAYEAYPLSEECPLAVWVDDAGAIVETRHLDNYGITVFHNQD